MITGERDPLLDPTLHWGSLLATIAIIAGTGLVLTGLSLRALSRFAD